MNFTNIRCEKRVYNKEYTYHQHEYGQFLFPLYGSMDIETLNVKVNLTPEHCFYLSPETNHLFRSPGDNEFLVLDIPKRVLPRGTNNMYVEMDNHWSSVRYLLLEETQSEMNTSSLTNLTNYITGKINTGTARSLEFIHKNFKQRLSIDMLAKIENYHPVYYSKWFKKETGKSVKSYLDELRLQEVKHLLLNSTLSITRIAEEINFENISSFTRWFVKNEGVSPYLYRELKK